MKKQVRIIYIYIYTRICHGIEILLTNGISNVYGMLLLNIIYKHLNYDWGPLRICGILWSLRKSRARGGFSNAKILCRNVLIPPLFSRTIILLLYCFPLILSCPFILSPSLSIEDVKRTFEKKCHCRRSFVGINNNYNRMRPVANPDNSISYQKSCVNGPND